MKRIAEHVGEPPRAVLAQQQHPGVERPRHHRRQQAGAGHLLEPERSKMIECRARRVGALAANNDRLLGVGALEDDRHFAAGAVEVRLDHLQHESSRDRRVKRVAAALEHRHAGGGREPMGRGDRPERAAQLGPGGERSLNQPFSGHLLWRQLRLCGCTGYRIRLAGHNRISRRRK
jgi:hypothetical protein